MHHKDLKETWHALSLVEQLGNAGSEISRAREWQTKDQKIHEGAVERALELLDLTIQDSRWQKRLKEIVRSREMFIDAIEGGKEFHTSLTEMEKYFFQFALAARLQR